MERRVWCLIAAAALAVVTGCDRKAPTPSPKPTPEPAPKAARIVSLTPSATEIVAALGAADLLVGVDDYSTYPPSVATLPKVGSFLSPNLEAIAALKPSLVIVDDIHGSTASALDALHIHAIECPMHALPDVKAGLLAVGAALDRSAAAKAAVDAIDHALDAAAAARPAQRPRVLIVIDRSAGGLDGLVAAGPGSWLDELVAVSGGENVLTGAAIRYPKISREEVLRTKPDVIIDAAFVATPDDPGKDWAALDVPAVANHRVRATKDAFLLAPSPRITEALAAVAAMLK